MRTPRILLALLLLLSLIFLSACNRSLVYKQDIQQGNVLDAEDIEALSLGMSKRQVLVLLGSPSIADPFHQDRWDYVSTWAPRGGKFTRKHLKLSFENDALASIDGDYLDSLTVANAEADEIEKGIKKGRSGTEQATSQEGPRETPDPVQDDPTQNTTGDGQ